MSGVVGFALILILLVSLPSAASAFAQEDHYAAKLTIAFAGVEIQRTGTTEWLPLPLGAETPFNVGDSLRTGDTGRAYLEFQTDGQLLVLPRSTYQLIEFAYAPDLHLSAKMTGQFVQKLTGQVGVYHLETPRLVITQASALLAVWDRDGSPASITSADGTARTEIESQQFTVSRGQGLLLKQADTPIINDLALPLTAPHLEGELFGCPGTIHTINNLNINIRNGIGSDVIGNAPNDSVVRVMGTNRNKSWYRIQIFSGFGWIQADLVQSACTALSVLPENSYEFNWGLQQIQPFEYALLEPFYGSTAHDPWYYVTFSAP
ncbi:MAG: hypothetical protein ABI700_18295 [Chloroflexota bacterium]